MKSEAFAGGKYAKRLPDPQSFGSKKKMGTCQELVYEEIKAYTAGGCKGLNGGVKECLRRRVQGSDTKGKCQSAENYKKVFEDNYEKCIQDMPH